MRVTLLLFVFMGVALAVAGQSSPLNRSLQFYKSGDLQHAKEVIDSAMMVAEYQQSATAWYLQGFIYKDLFKANPRTSHYREKAIESFIKFRELDKEQKYAKENHSELEIPRRLLLQRRMGFIEQGKYDDAVKSYEKFVQVASTTRIQSLTGRTTRSVSSWRSARPSCVQEKKTSRKNQPLVKR